MTHGFPNRSAHGGHVRSPHGVRDAAGGPPVTKRALLSALSINTPIVTSFMLPVAEAEGVELYFVSGARVFRLYPDLSTEELQPLPSIEFWDFFPGAWPFDVYAAAEAADTKPGLRVCVSHLFLATQSVTGLITPRYASEASGIAPLRFPDGGGGGGFDELLVSNLQLSPLAGLLGEWADTSGTVVWQDTVPQTSPRGMVGFSGNGSYVAATHDIVHWVYPVTPGVPGFDVERLGFDTALRVLPPDSVLGEIDWLFVAAFFFAYSTREATAVFPDRSEFWRRWFRGEG